MYSVCLKNLYILHVPPFTENYGENKFAIANEMHDLSALRKFYLMSKIVAEIQFVYRKLEKML